MFRKSLPPWFSGSVQSEMNDCINGIYPKYGGKKPLRNVAVYQLTRHRVSEDLNPQHHCENLKFRKSGLLSFMDFWQSIILFTKGRQWAVAWASSVKLVPVCSVIHPSASRHHTCILSFNWLQPAFLCFPQLSHASYISVFSSVFSY